MDLAQQVHDPKRPDNMHPKSRLLNLPAELRNTIHNLVLVDPRAFIIGDTIESPTPTVASLLATCTQIREEASPLYYALNSLRFLVSDAQPNTPTKWLSRRTRTESVVRSINNFTLEYTIDDKTGRLLDKRALDFVEALYARDQPASTRARNTRPDWKPFYRLLAALTRQWLRAGQSPPDILFAARPLQGFQRARQREWKAELEERWPGIRRRIVRAYERKPGKRHMRLRSDDQ